MIKNKKSFTLFSTIILVFIFSIFAIKIYEINSINSVNIINQYKYIQAKNHLDFLEEYVSSLSDLSLLNKIQIEDTKYEIIAFVKKINPKKYELNLTVKAINHDIRIQKKVILER